MENRQPGKPPGPEYVIRIVEQVGGVGTGGPTIQPGALVKAFDPEAFLGTGELTATWKPQDAKRYPSFEEAMADWTRVPKNRPFRPDGHPNRPMTAYTVEVVPVTALGADDIDDTLGQGRR